MDDTKEDNPWQVNQLEEFLYFCCPRCDSKCQAKDIFLDHALSEHPESSDFLEQFQFPEEPLIDDFKVKQEILDEDFLDNQLEIQDLHSKALNGKELQCYKCCEVMHQDAIESHLLLVHDVTVKEDYGKVRDFQCGLCHRALANETQKHKCIKTMKREITPGPKGRFKCKALFT